MVYSQYQRSEFEKLLDIRNRISINHPDGSKEVVNISELKRNTKSEKTYAWYKAQKINNTQGGYFGKLLHGQYRKFYSNKQLAIQGYYYKGLKTGKWTTWQNNGRLISEENWTKGTLSGAVKQFDNEGNISMEGAMKNGRWHGRVRNFTSTDSLANWYFYDHGNLISEDEYNNDNIFRKTASSLRRIWNQIFATDLKGSESQTKYTVK